MDNSISSSFWHYGLDYHEFDIPFSSLDNFYDYIIIGGGLSGSSALYWISKLLNDKNKNILLIERKHLASGATGRNGGHLKPVNNKEIECAKDMIKTLKKNNLLLKTETYIHSLNPFKAQINPAKFVIEISKLVVKNNKNIHIITNTPVLSIIQKGKQNMNNIIKTTKGNIQCNCILLCTNGYTRNILPDLSNCIIPTRGQCIVSEPLVDYPLIFYSNSNKRYNDGNSIYIIQRRNDHRIIAGGFREYVDGKESNIDDDSQINPIISNKLKEWLHSDERILDKCDKLIQIENEWTGIMGFTPNSKPIHGYYNKESNILISAGFNGHGMPVCFWASKDIVKMALQITTPKLLSKI